VNNGGLNFIAVQSLAVNGTNIFAGTIGFGVYLSTNNGTSWDTVNTGLINPYIQSLVVNGTNIFAGTGGGGVFLSTDNGISWNAINTGLTNTNVFSLAISGTTIFAGTANGVFLSTNNGTSWNIVNSGLPNNTKVQAFAINGSNIYIGTQSDGVFLSTNNGTSWIAINDGLTNMNVQSLVVNGTNLYTGTATNDVVWKRSLSEINGIEDNRNNSYFMLYPNPTSGKFIISNNCINTIVVHNVLGEIIYTVHNQKQQTLNEIDLSNYPKGIYFVKIYDGAKIHTEKIVMK
jgi:hypothetical protein